MLSIFKCNIPKVGFRVIMIQRCFQHCVYNCISRSVSWTQSDLKLKNSPSSNLTSSSSAVLDVSLNLLELGFLLCKVGLSRSISSGLWWSLEHSSSSAKVATVILNKAAILLGSYYFILLNLLSTGKKLIHGHQCTRRYPKDQEQWDK